jgi:hypothetical protein
VRLAVLVRPLVPHREILRHRKAHCVTWVTPYADSGPIPAGISGLLHREEADVDKVTDNKVVTIKPGSGQKWRVTIDGRSGDLPFSTRQLAIDFARAYAKLRRAGTLQVFN